MNDLRAGGTVIGLGQALVPAVMVVDLVAGDGEQPRPETVAGPVPAEVGQPRQERAEQLLHHIGGILLAQAGAAAPAVQHRPVEADQAAPGVRVVGADAVQQGQGGDGGRPVPRGRNRFGHGSFPR